MRRVYYLGVFVPVALALEVANVSAPVVFFIAALGVVAAAALMSDATEQLADRSGPGIAGLLNVTFGNTPELIIAVFALADGLQEVVKASLVGSVIGNSLLVLGAAMLAGGWRRTRQTFSRTAAQTQAGMLLVTVSALALPAVFRLAHGGALPAVGALRTSFGHDLEQLSVGVALVLIATYLAGLFFSLRTHRDVFKPEEEDLGASAWSVRRSLLTLLGAAGLVALASNSLVGSIEQASHDVGLSQFFIGVFVVAIVGNAAEHWVAVVAATKDKMDLSVNIAIGSSAQIGLFVAPVLVLLSFVVGPAPMALVFNGYEIAALLLTALITVTLTADGESTWFEGVQLIAVYVLLGLVFYFA
ncbi:MAG TPA: calcium/proton exchanger [Solirubrobacteraceae bacterium]|jgi:Ca2+:H+ antiporter|nr:calcium/proton exchanger [Solirubrobacteraceae bacterium]